MTITPHDPNEVPADSRPYLTDTVRQVIQHQAGRDSNHSERDLYSARHDQTVVHGQINVHGDLVQQFVPKPRGRMLHMLPPDAPMFIDRGQDLRKITAAANRVFAESGGRLVIHTIDGMPGIGKTALAVHAAHQLSSRFPDGQLFLDLHGHTPGRAPMPPEVALATLLLADDADSRDLPGTLQGRAMRWRDWLAHRRVLLLLDNAATSDQVIPLLPGNSACLVLVTSRRYLGDLPRSIEPMSLEVLPASHAQHMFLSLAPSAARDTSVARVDELVDLCGRLPLVISLLASRYADPRRPLTLAEMIDTYKVNNQRLLTIMAEKNTVKAAFDLSYEQLVEDRRRFLCYLGLHPGTVIDADAAAALAGVSPDNAIEHLDALCYDRLLIEIAPGRYGMHDLIRTYLQDRAAREPQQARDQALDHLLDYYQRTAADAATHLARESRDVPPIYTVTPPNLDASLSDYSHALAWYRTERANLLACLEFAVRTGKDERVIAFTAALAPLLRIDGPWSDAVALHTRAAATAERLGDRLGQAYELSQMGILQRLTGDLPRATETLEQALSLYQALNDESGEAYILNQLALVQRDRGNFSRTTEMLEQALERFRAMGERHSQAYVLAELGCTKWLSGDYRRAAELLEQALEEFRVIDRHLGQTYVQGELGIIRWMTGDYPGAAELLRQALQTYQELGDRLNQAYVQRELGTVHILIGDYPGATELLQQALQTNHDLGNHRYHAYTLIELSVVQRRTGNYPRAAQLAQQALQEFQDLGDQLGQAYALLLLGGLGPLTGDHRGAGDQLIQALTWFRAMGDRWGEGEALNDMGALRPGSFMGMAGVVPRLAGEDFDHGFRSVGQGRGPTVASGAPGSMHRVLRFLVVGAVGVGVRLGSAGS